MNIDKIYIVEEQEKDGSTSPVLAYTTEEDAAAVVRSQAILNIVLGMDWEDIADLAGVEAGEIEGLSDEEIHKLLMKSVSEEHLQKLIHESEPKGFYQYRQIGVVDGREEVIKEHYPVPTSEPELTAEFRLDVEKLLQWLNVTDEEAASFIGLYKRRLEKALQDVAMATVEDVAESTGLSLKKPF